MAGPLRHMTPRITTQELAAMRVEARAKLLPAAALPVMDAETQALLESGLAGHALGVGAVAPDFILPDVQGQCTRLYSLLKDGRVILVFYRGGWCPYCNIHLRGFQRVLPRLRQLGTHVVAISPQLPDHSLTTRNQDALSFPVLSDVGNKVARSYGLVFRLSDRLLTWYGKFGHPLDIFNGPDGEKELPMPTTFLIEQDARIRLADINIDYTSRLDPEEIIAFLTSSKT